MSDQQIRVGIGVMIWKDGKVLMGKRKGSHGAGEWAWPGGHLEYMESFEDCAKRETMEEAGIRIKNVRFHRLLNLQSYAPKHYVDIGIIADWESGEPEIREPDKMEQWTWVDPANLPEGQFGPIPTYFETLKTGKICYDTPSSFRYD
jgi:8-oxo-dGTP diphosphatase